MELTTDPKPATAKFVLWHRTSRRKPWQPVGTAGTEAELMGLLKVLPSGESICLRVGEHPDD